MLACNNLIRPQSVHVMCLVVQIARTSLHSNVLESSQGLVLAGSARHLLQSFRAHRTQQGRCNLITSSLKEHLACTWCVCQMRRPSPRP